MIHKRDVAVQISNLMIDCGAKLDASVALVKEQCSPQEFDAYRRAVGAVMAELLLGIMNPLYQQHPDLKPPELE